MEELKMSSSLRDRYWLTPEGPLAIEGREHAQIVKIIMLDLSGDDIPEYALIKNVYKPLTEEEVRIHLERGVDPEAVEFLAKGKDARLWALKRWGWVRTMESQFNCWIFDDDMLDMIRDDNRTYWDSMRPWLDEFTEVYMNEESSGEIYKLKALRMLNPAAQVGALKWTAKGIGRFRNPPRTGRYFRQ